MLNGILVSHIIFSLNHKIKVSPNLMLKNKNEVEISQNMVIEIFSQHLMFVIYNLRAADVSDLKRKRF
jgi:hypothetical protein